MKNRGANNLDYDQGFIIEQTKFNEYKPILLDTLQANQIELTTRGLLDKATGTDAVAEVDGLIYGVSLRFRGSDYNSFTLNRHISDPYSEVHKWQQPHTTNYKPQYYIQINERPNNELRLIRINIDAFGEYLKYLIKSNQLETHYQSHLKAYEFYIPELKDKFMGIHSKVLTLQPEVYIHD